MTGHRVTRRITGIGSAALAALAFFAAFSASPARADQCDDIAKQLANSIDGLKVNFKAANIIYLAHPAAAELSLGCRGKEYSNELYAKGDRKLKPEFLNLVGSAAAIIFTLPKDDTMTGTSRCLKRMGIRAATRSRCATSGSTWNATAPRKKPRSRSGAASTSRSGLLRTLRA